MELSAPQEIQERFQALRENLEERKRILPCRTYHPHSWMAIEEAEGRVRVLEAQVSLLPDRKGGLK